MAAKALGLFLLLFWTSGLVKSIYIPKDGWNEEIDHPRHISPNLRWRYIRLADKFPNLLNRNPNLEFRISGLQFHQPDTKFDKSVFQKNRKEGFMPNVPNLNSVENSTIPYLSSPDESVSSSPVPNKVTRSKYSDFDWNEKKGEYLYLTKDRPENVIKSTTKSDSPTGPKSSVLYLEPNVEARDNRPVTDTETSESGHSTSSIDDFSSANSQRIEETDEVNTRSDLTLSPELNSLSTENSIVTGIENATEELQNGTDNSSQNDSDSYTTENTTGTEITSNSYGNSSEDGNTVHTDRASTSTPEENTASTEVNTDSSVSYTSATPTAIQTGESTAPSTSYSTQRDEIQSTTNQLTTASEMELIVTSKPTSSTDEANDISSTIIGFTESEFTSTTVVSSESEAISTTEGFTESEFISTTVGFTESEFISTTVGFTESEFISTNVGFTESEFSTKSGKEITEAIPQDHVIKIKSIRTARVIVSVVFIVIVLVATVVLAIYTFRVKRRAVQYDQLMLLP